MELNAARIKLLQAQDDVVTGMRENAGEALVRVTKDANTYKKILKGLIVQVSWFPNNLPLLRLIGLDWCV